MKIEPLQDRILVQREEAEQLSKIIVTPENTQEKSMIAKVLAVGPGRWEMMNATDRPSRIKPDVKVGERVVIGKYSGTVVELERGKEFILLREDEILGRIK